MTLGKCTGSCGGAVLYNLRNMLFSSEVLNYIVGGLAATSVTFQMYLVVVYNCWWYIFVCCDTVLQELLTC